ncbi:cobyrinate a,c-diamide synthase [bacterium]|nr:MAG: cobyrinate a,c-diamide synthase [bacterium]
MKSAFVIAAPRSGAGKTTVTLSIMAALKARGLFVQPFKAGPDYIDTAHHRYATGAVSYNLDTWMLPPEANLRIFRRESAGAEVSVVEGVMGLFDGVDGRRPDGSTADLARLLDLPIVLVVDARSMARSAAALVKGFVEFDKNLRFAGIIWNRVGTKGHRRILDEALEEAGLPQALGAFGRHNEIAIPHRHLGLVTPEDMELLPGFFDNLAAMAEESVELDRLLIATRTQIPPEAVPAGSAKTKTVAVARDRAFCFYYEENLKILEGLGARLVFFAPTDGDAVPPEAEALYLGGGYPELHADKISRNEGFLNRVRDMHARGLPIYAECGGFMTLCRAVEDCSGTRSEMAGIFPSTAKMGKGTFSLGYREVEGTLLSPVPGKKARGHEFHYSTIEEMGGTIERAYRVRNSRGEELAGEGYLTGKTLGGYIHLHFASNPAFAAAIFGLE